MVELDIKNLKGITQDSRGVRDGYLFAALPGSKDDGRKYIEDAVRNGASAILTLTGTEVPGDTPVIYDDNPRKALALIAAEFYGVQPEYIAAVTGTNGKTSTVHFVEQIWKSQGVPAASIGTLGVRSPGQVRSGSMTTPDPVSLHAELADLAAVGITHLAMESSSHGLDQYRLDGVKIKTAGFTNLSRDHLDYHENMGKYFNSKMRLFSELLDPVGTAVLNADIQQFGVLHDIALERGASEISYGAQGQDIKLLDIQPAPDGQNIKLKVIGKEYELTLPLVGDFQVMNALCALGLVLAEGQSKQDNYVEALENLQGAPGRLQLVSGHPKNAAVYIDYAHTPDALGQVLQALRPHTQNRLVCLFGCGGDRDSGKRPMMGEIAGNLADHVIVTDDNPRTEDPAEIRKQIIDAAKDAQEIDGRREAIQTAIEGLQEGDVLVISGKGHEQGQIFADHREDFDDFEEAEKAIKELG